MEIPFAAERFKITAFGAVVALRGSSGVIGDEIRMRFFAIVMKNLESLMKRKLFDHVCSFLFQIVWLGKYDFLYYNTLPI